MANQLHFHARPVVAASLGLKTLSAYPTFYGLTLTMRKPNQKKKPSAAKLKLDMFLMPYATEL
jgi:hypothetical protein